MKKSVIIMFTVIFIFFMVAPAVCSGIAFAHGNYVDGGLNLGMGIMMSLVLGIILTFSFSGYYEELGVAVKEHNERAAKNLTLGTVLLHVIIGLIFITLGILLIIFRAKIDPDFPWVMIVVGSLFIIMGLMPILALKNRYNVMGLCVISVFILVGAVMPFYMLKTTREATVLLQIAKQPFVGFMLDVAALGVVILGTMIVGAVIERRKRKK